MPRIWLTKYVSFLLEEKKGSGESKCLYFQSPTWKMAYRELLLETEGLSEVNAKRKEFNFKDIKRIWSYDGMRDTLKMMIIFPSLVTERMVILH